MKIKCTVCGTPIPAANINIQKMLAVCANCDNIIDLDSTFQHKSRKVRQPEQFSHYEDGTDTHFAFKWSWRTEPRPGFIVMMVLLSIAVSMLLAAVLRGAWNINLLFLILMGAYPAFYGIGLMFNSTHYVVEGETLTVYTAPFWFPRYGRKTIPLDDITEITTKNTYNFGSDHDSFYHVYARTIDGRQHAIAAYVNYEHAHYIAQELQQQLQTPRSLSGDDTGYDEPIAQDTTVSQQQPVYRNDKVDHAAR